MAAMKQTAMGADYGIRAWLGLYEMSDAIRGENNGFRVFLLAIPYVSVY